MNTDEKRAFEYLKLANIGEIIFEPNGPKTAPDFGLAGQIAVEVTRLNQHFRTSAGVQGLETSSIALNKKFHDFVHAFEPHPPILEDQSSWFISFVFRRPVEKWSSIEPVLTEILNKFAAGDRLCRNYKINQHFNISLHQAGKRYDSFFRQGGFVDQDCGGFVTPEIQANLKVCLNRKHSLLAALTHYSKRWLILVDHVSFGSWDDFRAEANEWDRTIILSPEGHMRSFEPCKE